MRTDTVIIRTPEGIEFSLALAGPFSRMLAFLLDLAVISAAGTAIGYVILALRLISQDAAEAVGAVLYFAVSLLYGILTEWLWRGQTIGKRLVGLRVVDAGGLRLRAAQIVIRNLMRFIDLLPGIYLVGGASVVLNSKHQRLGDIAAGTIVIQAGELKRPDTNQLLGQKFNSLVAYPHLCARLRQWIPPDVAHLALEAVLRRDEIDPASRLGLFKDFAAYLKELVRFPEDATELLSDEQYVRNVLAILFQSSPVETSRARPRSQVDRAR